MDTSRRGLVPLWLNAVEAVSVWNRVGNAYQEKRPDPAAASDLEAWFTRFVALWRQVGREAELEQVRRCVFWYADSLRS